MDYLLGHLQQEWNDSIKEHALSFVWWITISTFSLHHHTHTHTHTHTHRARRSLSGWPPWFTGSQHHLPSRKHYQVPKLFLPDIQRASSDSTFLSESGWEALSCYFLSWIMHHIREQHLTPMRHRVYTSPRFENRQGSNSSHGWEDSLSFCKALSHHSCL